MQKRAGKTQLRRAAAAQHPVADEESVGEIAYRRIRSDIVFGRLSPGQKLTLDRMKEAYGASVTSSPSTETDSGRAILAAHPDTRGSLGIAISEAVEVAAKDPDTKYALGSVLNHVLLHQTVIGLESIDQMALAGDEPHWPAPVSVERRFVPSSLL